MAVTVPREIKTPFQVDPATGSIAFVDDPVILAGQHIISVVATEPTERVMRYRYGVPLREFVFEPVDAFPRAELEQRITQAVEEWVPDARIRELVPIGSAEEALLGFHVDYTIVGDPDLTVHRAMVEVGGSVRDVTYG